jgi:hypothetical protein
MLPPGCVGWTVLPPIMVGGDVQRPHVGTVGFQEIWSRRFAFAVRSGGTPPKHSPVRCGGEWSRRSDSNRRPADYEAQTREAAIFQRRLRTGVGWRSLKTWLDARR